MSCSVGDFDLTRKLEHVFDSSFDGLWVMDNNDIVHFKNDNFYSQFELPSMKSHIGKWFDLIHPKDRFYIEQIYEKSKSQDNERVNCVYRVRNKSGQYIWIESNNIFTREKGIVLVVGCHRDITERKLLSEYLSYLTHHDKETGLPNYNKWVIDKNSSSYNGLNFIISVRNIESYIRVGVSGIAAEVVSNLIRWFGRNISDYELYRISQNVFLVRTLEFISEGNIEKISNGLVSDLSKVPHENLNIDRRDIGLGVVFDSNILENFSVNFFLRLIEYSYISDCIVICNAKNLNSIEKYFSLRDDLHDAILSGEVIPYFQPLFDAKKERVIAYEALARWQHPKFGIVEPSIFIPMAEKMGLITMLGYTVFRYACAFKKGLLNDCDISINVNVSALQLKEYDFLDNILSITTEVNVDPKDIVLELTESKEIDSTMISDVLKRLITVGFNISIDDFGSGYSNVRSLIQLPIKQIKIDKDIVNLSLSEVECSQIIDYLVFHCDRNNIELVAEGIENEALKSYFLSKGVFLLQGYYIGEPMPIDKIN
ncbi:EAL domain-containing protein [Vibrio fluvialis]|nr:EAL domain-containing protein [Vibrio fluvialis]